MSKVIIIDSKNLLFKSCYTNLNLITEINEEDVFVGGLYGYLKTISNLYQEHACEIVAVWEGKNNFRYDIYPDYKKHAFDEKAINLAKDVKQQTKLVQTTLRMLNIKQYGGVECEADDVMARLAKEYEKKGYEVIVYTTDSDLRQIITENINVLSSLRGNTVRHTLESIRFNYDIEPIQITIQKAIAGDSSDNIIGVRNIGDAKALKLIHQYGTLENIIKAAENDDDEWPINESLKQNILESEQLYMNLALTTIRINLEYKEIKRKENKKLFKKLLRYYGLKNLMLNPHFSNLMMIGE